MHKPNPWGCCENPGICLTCTQGQKSLKGLPRATHCTGHAQTSGNVTPTVELCPPYPTFRTKVRAQRDVPEEKRDDNCTYTYKAPLRGVRGVPRGLTQAGMPQGKNKQWLSLGNVWVIPCVRNIYLWINVIPWIKIARLFLSRSATSTFLAFVKTCDRHNFHVQYHDLGEWGLPRVVTQAGIL